MTRITTTDNDPEKPRINKAEVEQFFKTRASKVDALGPTRAVIYQDKHPDLAERRDVAEKARLIPVLKLDGAQRILDVGCGTGRWTTELASRSKHYHGIDFSADLIEYASRLHQTNSHQRFSVASADNYSLDSLGESEAFDRVLCCGVLIYLNDEDVIEAFRCMNAAAAERARIVLREPMAVYQRLSVIHHFSDELNQNYNAIYRTEHELRAMMRTALADSGFEIIDSGDVYLDGQLNNRTETIQRLLVLERT